MAEKRSFPGIGDYLDLVGVDPARKPEAFENKCLKAAVDLIGEAYAKPEAAGGILAAAEERARVVYHTAEALELAMEDAYAALVAPEPEPADGASELG